MAELNVDLSDPAVRPFTAFRFAVEIQVDDISDEICAAAFSEVDGIEMSIEPKTIQEGGRNTGPVHLMGPIKHGQLTLRRGMSANFDLWTWFDRVTSPGYRGLRPQAEIVVLSSDGAREEARFILEGVLPVRLKAPALNGREGQVAIEEMQLVYETMRWSPGGGASGQTTQGRATA